MKFSYSWLKSYLPNLPSKAKTVEALSLYSFEAERAEGDTIEVSLQPNRYADASGHIGIARELAASRGVKFAPPKSKKVPRLPKTKGWLPVKVVDADLCSRYVAVFVDGVRVKQSPAWMQKRLKACGVRPINNVVDVMNYVMLETGQPLHAFDADKIAKRGSQGANRREKAGIYVRRAKKKEKITTLDDQEVALDKDILVIADNVGPLAIAGIKGGKRAEVGTGTKKIIIESAHFDSTAIYKAARQLNIRTDASDRFSREMSPALCAYAAERAAELLAEIGAAQKAVGLVDIGKKQPTPSIIDVNIEWLHSFLGIDIPLARITKILRTLDCSVVSSSRSRVRVRPSPLRLDIRYREDVAEEIARIFGYANIPSKAPVIFPASFSTPEDLIKEKMRDILRGLGISETYNYSFVSKRDAGVWAGETAVKVANPISEHYTHLRTTLYPHLLRNVADNLRFFTEVRLFEIGRIFAAEKGEKTSEHPSLGIALSRKGAAAKELFYEIKGLVEHLCEALGITDYDFHDTHDIPDFLIPGQAAHLRIGDADMGALGIAESVAAHTPVAYAELDMERLIKAVEEELEYAPIPKFPSIERDISMFVDKQVRIADIQNAVFSASVRYVRDVDLLDIYEGDDIPDNSKSIAVRIVFQANNRTLSDDEADVEMQAITKTLEEECDAEIR